MNIFHLHVSGTHCTSCKIFIEDILQSQDGIRNASVDLSMEILVVETEAEQSPEDLATFLTKKLHVHGYTVSVENRTTPRNRENVLWQALPIGLSILVLFFMLQKSSILDIGFGGPVTPITSFVIGIIASLSSCLAIVGGLVLSLSAEVSQDDESDTKTFVLFHVGRLVSFALLGGALGILGSAVQMSFTLSAILGLVASTVMIFLGLQLVGVFRRNSITVPSGLFTFFRRLEHTSYAPLILGFATFFLPCGFTQSMQVTALSSGSFVSGLSIMLAFAVGTLPMLVFLSFGSASFARSRYAPLFFASAGIVVIGLGIFSLLSGFAGVGIIDPLFTL